jgi:hypothetical protein
VTTATIDCFDPPLQVQHRYILMLDHWAVAGAYSTAYPFSGVWPIEGDTVTLPGILTQPGASHAGRNTMPLSTLLAELRATVAAAMRAPLGGEDRALIDEYRVLLRNAVELKGQGTDWIEKAVATLDRVRTSLMASRNGKIVLEALSDEEYGHLRAELPGIRTSREEVVFVEPDVDYFVAFTAENGADVDQTFFRTLKATRSSASPTWPSYVERQTDYSGCTRFGNGTLVDAYRAWTHFAKQFPGRYTAAVKRYLGDVVSNLTASTCACGSAADVDRELTKFLGEFPAAPERAEVEARLQALRAGKSNIRMSCRSG